MPGAWSGDWGVYTWNLEPYIVGSGPQVLDYVVIQREVLQLDALMGIWCPGWCGRLVRGILQLDWRVSWALGLATGMCFF